MIIYFTIAYFVIGIGYYTGQTLGNVGGGFAYIWQFLIVVTFWPGIILGRCTK